MILCDVFTVADFKDTIYTPLLKCERSIALNLLAPTLKSVL